MSKSRSLRVFAPLAAALTLAFASMSAMAADTVAPVLQAAMQRDLGLSGTQLAQYLKIERLATRQQTQLQSAQGRSFAGSWIERQADGSFRFVVATTSIAPQRSTADVEFRRVDRTLVDLEAAKTELDRAASHDGRAPQGVYSWRVDPQTNSVVVGIGKGAHKAAVDFVASSAADAGAIRFETMAEAPRLFATLQGGSEYISSADGQSGYYCSVGFSVTQSGNQGFATAGHCSEGQAGWGVYVSGGRRQGATRIGSFAASTMPDANQTGPDRAWVQVDSGNTLLASVSGYGSGDVAVHGSTEAAIGAAVCRSGRTTGWHCGAIRAKNVTVSYVDQSGNPDGTVTGLTQSSACAEGGDSGGSFITGAGQGQGVLSGGSGSCKGRQGQDGGGNTYFSPLNPILQSYNLTLRTSL